MDGILRCSRYAFGPNRLHYCGPDANREIFSYIQEEASDKGLENLLRAFKTMYPYLRLIAEANAISDPLDERVVEAYWIGNELLETVEKKKFWQNLIESHQMKKRLGAKAFELIGQKIKQGAVPHHSFHVLDIWKRTGHFEREHTPETMDNCCIKWGLVKQIDGPAITAETEPILYKNRRLFLGEPVQKKFIRTLESDTDIEQLKPGDIVTVHWNVICEVITPRQLLMLKKYTLGSIQLANLTI